jgi:hypothetical protein
METGGQYERTHERLSVASDNFIFRSSDVNELIYEI